MEKKNIYCNNCGRLGHVYRECKFPVISCGNIIFRLDTEEPKILMIQRKDSLCYIDFIRGKYDIYNITYIQTLIDKCTISEKQKLITDTYETLWKRLWLVDTLEDVSNNDYARGYDKFTRLTSGFLYNSLVIFFWCISIVPPPISSNLESLHNLSTTYSPTYP